MIRGKQIRSGRFFKDDIWLHSINYLFYVRHKIEEAALSSLSSGLSSGGSESQSGVALSLFVVLCRGYDSVRSFMLERSDSDL